MQGIKKLLAIGIAVVMLGLPAQAMAQSPTNDSYDESSITVVDPNDPAGSGSSHDPASSAASSGSRSGSHDSGGLPFTGLDIALLAAMGACLVGLGLGMRRMTRSANAA